MCTNLETVLTTLVLATCFLFETHLTRFSLIFQLPFHAGLEANQIRIL